jgi:hypothetical protein
MQLETAASRASARRGVVLGRLDSLVHLALGRLQQLHRPAGMAVHVEAVGLGGAGYLVFGLVDLDFSFAQIVPIAHHLCGGDAGCEGP